MPLRKLFHLMAIVDDFDESAAFYDRLFSPKVIMAKSWSPFDKRWASIGIVGDLPWELMEPSKDPEDAGVPLAKFRARFGEHLHSLAWFVGEGEMTDVVRRLQAKDVRVVRADSTFIRPEDDVPDLVFTHARDTLGQIELSVPTPGWNDPRITGDWGDRSATWWQDQHPLGLVRLSHVTLACRDLARGLDVFEWALGGTVLDRGDAHAYVLVGDDTIVHLAVPTDDRSALALDLAANGELPHQATWLVRDLGQAEAHALSCGASLLEKSEDTILLDPATTFGSRLAFTTTPPPNDPR